MYLIDANLYLMKSLLFISAFYYLTHLAAADSVLINGSFEDDFNDKNGWILASNLPPVRSDKVKNLKPYRFPPKKIKLLALTIQQFRSMPRPKKLGC